MDIPQITLDAATFKLSLSVVGGLLVIAMVRIVFLLRTNKRLQESTAKMEQQVLMQHQEILSVRSDSNAWRGEVQRMFDAFRAELSNRLVESEARYQEIQQPSQTVRKHASFPPPPPPATFMADPEQSAVFPMPALNIS